MDAFCKRWVSGSNRIQSTPVSPHGTDCWDVARSYDKEKPHRNCLVLLYHKWNICQYLDIYPGFVGSQEFGFEFLESSIKEGFSHLLYQINNEMKVVD